MKITKSKFGDLDDQQEVMLFSLENDNGILVKITNYGGIITHIYTPDKNGKNDDVVLGFDEFEKYTGEHPYFGAIVGRFANRIAGGKFELNGKLYKLAVNNGPNHLHGGIEGFDKKLWTAWTEKKEGEVILKLAYESEHMEEGYPGNLMVEVSYSLNNKNELIIDYKAESDQDTIINLTNHSYFNLNIKNGNILDHDLQMDCSGYTPVDDSSIPKGGVKEVKGTAYDFTEMKKIRKDFAKLENGYDHNFVIDKKEDEFKWFARVREKESGRVMEVGTSQPGVQFYTANFLDNIKGKDDWDYKPQHALCLETQHFPDSPNRPDFPSVVLKKSEQYSQKTVYKFSVED